MKNSSKIYFFRRRLVKLLPYLVLIAMLVLSILPLISMLGTSFRSKATLMTTSSIFPDEWSVYFYQNVLSDPRVVNYFKNSFVVSAVVCLLTLIISIPGGYCLARFGRKVKGISFYSIFLMMLQMFPIVQLIIPLYLTFTSLNMVNMPYTLICAYPAFTLPMNLWMMKSFIESIPYEMEEAGRIDGCSRLKVLLLLVIPVSKPGIASSAILAFNYCWNEFFLAMVMIKKDELRTMPIGLQNYIQESSSDWGSIMAASTLMLIPILLFLNLLSRNIVGGLTMGTVKG